MKNTLRNFLITGLIMACVPAMAAPIRQSSQPSHKASADTAGQARSKRPAEATPISKEQEELNHLLYCAICLDDVSKVEQLLARGAGVNMPHKTRNGQTETPIMVAAKRGLTQLCKLFIARGVDVNFQLERGWTALAHAISNGHEETCKLLIAAGADVNAINIVCPHDEPCMPYQKCQYHTPITIALIKGHERIAGQLIAAGADLDTALMIAAAHRCPIQGFKFLIAAGANVNATVDDGYTPLMAAAKAGNAELCKLLIAAGADLNAKIEYLPELLLLRGKGDVMSDSHARWIENENKEYGYTALMIASNLGDFYKEVCKVLIDAGADLNTRGIEGETALMLAVKRGQKEICKMLLKAGADTKIKNREGKTAGQIAAKIAQNVLNKAWRSIEEMKNCEEIYQLLVAHDAATVGKAPSKKTVSKKHATTRFARLKTKIVKFFKQS